MAKKFVRGVTGVEDIESFDKTLTNVNDILSDGQDTYVHTKKGRTESYYKLTDSVKTIESTEGTINVEQNEGGLIKVDTDPEIVLEHDNLRTGDGLLVVKNGNTSTISLDSTKKSSDTILSTLNTSLIYGLNFQDGAEQNTVGGYITLKISDNKRIQFYTRESGATQGLAIMSYRFVTSETVTPWREMLVDNAKIMSLLSQKQSNLSSNTSIGVLSNNQLSQLFTLKHTYTHANGFLKTHVKSVAENTAINTALEEFNFTVKINQNAQNIVVTLNEHDTTAFGKIMTAYGSNNTVHISGCVFTLSGSSLTIETSNNTAQNYVITFSDILD